MTADELAVILRILQPRLVGGFLQKIREIAPDRLLLGFHRSGVGATQVLVDLTPTAPRLQPTERRFQAPKSAPPFSLALRKLLSGARLEELRQEPGDRVVRFRFLKKEDDRLVPLDLVVEAIPRRAGLFVLDEQARILLASSAREDSRGRLVRGKTWSPPPPPPPKSDVSTPFSEFPGWTDETLTRYLDEQLTETVSQDDVDVKGLAKELTKAIKRQFKRISKIEADVRRLDSAKDAYREGEALKAALGDIEKGATRARVRDWSTDPPSWIEIDLDPKLSPIENVERIFKEAKKRERGLALAEQRLKEQRRQLQHLQSLEELLRDDSPEARELLLEETRALGIDVPRTRTPAEKKAPPAPRLPYKTYHSENGTPIWVGRSSRDNDALTFHHAKGNHWWLHAEDYPGSHVVVPMAEPLPPEVLVDAATLALGYSKAPKGGKQGVSYTRRKHVTKFKGAKPGQVLLQQRKTILIRIDPDRWKRLTGRTFP
ncbi:MAG TPA: fibronectin-binding domain-containing protein [Planctomycetes bacterium]|nr:fibronectin-binding domain-containing protein [Planctomycetota bacterium]